MPLELTLNKLGCLKEVELTGKVKWLADVYFVVSTAKLHPKEEGPVLAGPSMYFDSKTIGRCVLVTQSFLTLCEAMNLACQATVSMQFSRQEYLSGCHAPFQGIFPTDDQTWVSALESPYYLSHLRNPSMPCSLPIARVVWECDEVGVALLTIILSSTISTFYFL